MVELENPFQGGPKVPLTLADFKALLAAGEEAVRYAQSDQSPG